MEENVRGNIMSMSADRNRKGVGKGDMPRSFTNTMDHIRVFGPTKIELDAILADNALFDEVLELCGIKKM